MTPQSQPCVLCLQSDTMPIGGIENLQGGTVPTRFCRICGCFNLDWESQQHESPDAALQRQVQKHEMLWSDLGADELAAVATELSPLVTHIFDKTGKPSAEGLVLEIGSGRGSFLQALVNAGVNAIGCEPSVSLSSNARHAFPALQDRLFTCDGLKLLSDLEQIKPNQSPEILIMWHVIEHVPKPLELIDAVLKIVPTGAKIVMQVPMLQKRNVVPEHFFLFTRETLDFLCSKGSLKLLDSEVDLKNMYLTGFFEVTSTGQGKLTQRSSSDYQISGIGEVLTLKDTYIDELESLCAVRMDAITEMGGHIFARDQEISELRKRLNQKRPSLFKNKG